MRYIVRLESSTLMDVWICEAAGIRIYDLCVDECVMQVTAKSFEHARLKAQHPNMTIVAIARLMSPLDTAIENQPVSEILAE